MKKTLLTVVCALLSLGSVVAKPVDVGNARRVAETYMRAQGMKNVSALQNVTSQTPFTEFYVFAAPEGGFILVSADDCVQPVLGYSVENRFMAKNMPENVRSFLENYEREIRWWKNHQEPVSQLAPSCVTNRESSASMPALWRELLDGVAPQPTLTTAVSPLLTTTWDQAPYYNDLCPSDSAGLAATGCVATATAQVMKYHNHPAQGYGSHTYTSSRTINGINFVYPNLSVNFGNTTYQWSQMPNVLNASSTTAQVNAVATLMYHIGVANEMAYSPYASGSNNYYGCRINSQRASSQESLARYFKYRPDMAVAEREAYSHDRYVSILRGELDQQRPILYSGNDSTGGHSFVLDGYDSNAYFHVNWGWGGWTDGYYAIGGLEPGTGGIGANMGSYNMGDGAVIGIRPNTSWNPTAVTSIGAYMHSMAPAGASAVAYNRTTDSITDTYSFGDTVVLLATLPEGYCFSGWSDGDSFNPREILATGGSYNFTATCEPIGLGDTVGYCRGNIRTLSPYDGGVKLPASALDTTKQLTSVMFYAYLPDTYTITVYTGANHSTTAATATYTVSAANANAWQTVALSTPVPATDDIWIIISGNDPDGYPVSLTVYSGVPSSFILVWNGNYYDYGEQWQATAMIKGIFSDSIPQPGNDCLITSLPWNYSFITDSISDCWTNIDADGDGLTWMYYPNYGAVSFSYVEYNGNGYSLTPDDWLISPRVTLPAGGAEFNYTYLNVAASYPDHIGVFVSTTDTARSSFTLLESYTAVAADTVWHTRTVNLSAYAGQQVYIAIRHYNSDDNYAFVVGSVSVTAGSTPVQQYTITVASNDATMGTVTGGGTYNEGATVTLIATANSGYHFVSWQDGNTANPRTITVTGNATYTASFEADAPTPVATCLITSFPYTENFDDTSTYSCLRLIDANGDGASWGVIDSFGTAYSRAAYIMYAVEADDYLILPGITTPGSYILSWKARAYQASYPETYQVYAGDSMVFSETLSATTLTTRNTTFTVSAGDTVNVMFRYISDDMYAFFLDDITIASSTEPLPPTQYTITVASNDATMGTVTGGGTYNEGATVTLTATANSGYHFVSWQDGNIANPRTVTVTADATYTATFAADMSCPPVSAFPYTESFDGSLDCWTVIDGNNDGSSWLLSTGITGGSSTVSPHSGTGMAASFSWNGDALYANEYLVSPQFILPAGQTITLSWWFRVNGSYPEDKLAVKVSTTGNNVANFTTTLFDITPTATHGNWTQQTIDLSAYAGQSIYLAFHHHDSYDANYLLVDDIMITASSATPTQYTLTVLSNNDNYGTVTGGGTYNAGATATLTTAANSGYHFVQWQDGNTNATRTVTVTADATYIATFEANGSEPVQYTLTVLSNNNDYGTVTGGGTYNEGTAVTLTATANSGYHFVQWQDGNTNATRTVTVTTDATYIATFEANVGIEVVDISSVTLYPNPASDIVTIDGLPEGAMVSLIDLNGRMISEFRAESSKLRMDISRLTSGQYFVRIVVDGTIAIRKLVVE